MQTPESLHAVLVRAERLMNTSYTAAPEGIDGVPRRVEAGPQTPR